MMDFVVVLERDAGGPEEGGSSAVREGEGQGHRQRGGDGPTGAIFD